MNLRDKFQQITNSANDDNSRDLTENSFLTSLLFYITEFTFLLAGLWYLFNNSFIPSLVLLFAFIMLAVIRYLGPINQQFYWPNRLFVSVIAVVLAFFYYAYPTSPFAWGILFIMPFVTVIMLGKNLGTLTSLIFLMLCIPATVFHKMNGYEISPNFYITTLGGILIFTSLIFVILGIINSRIKELNEKIERSNKELYYKNEFIAKLSHQLRTSLSNILLVNNLVHTAGLNEAQSDLLNTLKASTNNLIEAVNRIVEFSQSDLMHFKESNISFDLLSTMENIVKLFSESEYASIKLNFSSSIENYVIGDPIKIKQIFLNLLQGIIIQNKDLPQNILINVIPESETKSQIKIAFIIETNYTEKINGGNYSLYSSPEKTEPEDLENINKLIFSTGGRLDIQRDGKLVIYKFSINYIKDTGNRIAEIHEKPEKRAGENIKLKDANILLVEDNQINQKIVILSLKNLVKTVDVASNGKEALDKFGTSRYDLILMDVQMPVMDGIIAAKKIREIEASTNTQTPIIAITANALSGDRENCLAVGMDDYISKPFQVDILVQKMKKLLEKVEI